MRRTATFLVAFFLGQLGACSFPDFDIPIGDDAADTADATGGGVEVAYSPPVCADQACQAVGGTCQAAEGGYLCLLLDEACGTRQASVCKDDGIHRCSQGFVVATLGSSCGTTQVCRTIADTSGAEYAKCVDNVTCPVTVTPQVQPIGIPLRLACDRDALIYCETTNPYPSIMTDCTRYGEHCSTGGITTCTIATSGPAAIEWRSVPAGQFTPSVGRIAGAPAVVPAFQMLRTEVTLGQYLECVQAGGCRGGFGCEPPSDRGDIPLSCTLESTAAEYCAWLGGRLPTAAEWEYAARNAGHDVAFPWGDDPATCADISSPTFGPGAPDCATGPSVGCAHPRDITAQGICDLVGNLEEWVQRVDASGASERGHSYSYLIESTTLGGGDGLYTSGGDETIGFRCVR